MKIDSRVAISSSLVAIAIVIRAFLLGAVFVVSSGRFNLAVANPVADLPFAGSFPQQEDGWTAIKTDEGILFIWNRKDLSFTLSIKGNEIRPMDAGENIFFAVDGLVLQIQSLPISNFAPDARTKKLDEKSILMAHRDWEVRFLENELLHSKLTVQSSSEKLANGREALIWQFDLPEGFRNADATKQMYLSVVAKDYIVLLNGVVNATASESTVRNFLLEKIATLKISADRIDVKKLQESIRKGNAP